MPPEGNSSQAHRYNKQGKEKISGAGLSWALASTVATTWLCFEIKQPLLVALSVNVCICSSNFHFETEVEPF